jgi:hypothetical protein
MRPAITLVELLVAIMVLSVGLIALAATAGLVASHVGDGARLTSSAHTARSLLDSLGTLDCTRVVSGRLTRDGIGAEWIVSSDSLAATVRLTVASQLRRGERQTSYQLIVPCTRS